MSIKAKIIIDGISYNVLSYSFGVRKKADDTGRPYAQPLLSLIYLTIESTKRDELYYWSIQSHLIKQAELHLIPRSGDRTIIRYLVDCHCLFYKVDFDALGSHPMTTTIELSAGGLKDSVFGSTISNYWLQTPFVEEAPIEVEEEEEEKKPKILTKEWRDQDNNAIKETEVNKDSALFLTVKDIDPGEELKIILEDIDNASNTIELRGIVQENGEVQLKQ